MSGRNGGYCRPMPGTVTEPIEDAPESSARAAGLRYVSDREPGFARRRRGKGFQYIDADGGALSSEQVERIEALAIPPAWTDVWICRSANGHLQATGRDARGRKQYRYHPRWTEVRDETKYHRLLAFARALPRIRRRVEKDMSRKALSRETGDSHRRASARHDQHPGRKRRIRAGEQVVRPDHHARTPRGGGRLAYHLSVSRKEREDARRRADRSTRRACAETVRGAARAGAVPVRGRARERWSTSTPTTSTATSRMSREATSRPRTSAPGQAPCSRRGRCRSWASSTRRRRRSGRWWRP